MLDEEACYRAVQGRDARFDGVFYLGVTSTGIYCRPSCPAMTPKRENVRFYRTAAEAQAAGFRTCRRCRPDATPGSAEWNIRADVVGRAMRLIADGVVDRDGVAGLAARLGYSERQVHRTLVEEVGAGPLRLARSQRAHTARVLLETTELPVTEIAFTAGFASVRQFNDTIREVYALTPTELRGKARRRGRAATAGTVELRLAYRQPADLRGVLDFLALRAVPGVEEVDGGTYRRSLTLPHGTGVAELTPRDGWLQATLRLADPRDLTAAVARCRRVFDLDADPQAVDDLLGADPALGPLVVARPGTRVPGTVDGDELAVRGVLGQQVSVAAARTVAGRLVAEHGKPLDAPVGTVTHAFPTAAVLASVDPSTFPMPRSRQRTLHELTSRLADGTLSLDPGVDRDEAERRLLDVPGIGPWTARYVRMRALADPDVFLPTDLGVKHALAALGLPSEPRAVAELAENWRPWRSYALLHVWATL
ncbi:DNA-3-methyladenine glycosylase 2 family protein [Jiangella rhizosphaerae]|uniref:DNA-3-methyladenine glycosylase II n=1 Tax=Jiangella rhizosphaerae TaxID=2293569 RepID=A0A418KRZ5_9ACTN|nr:DNA-3-methyladenine glycosylase 2 family protein [Jiangella rhizosphaerae]RIQ25093.1 DNA-3-methyladenine glycosylase 2 family protein [Jiangella rhizosphaerae]